MKTRGSGLLGCGPLPCVYSVERPIQQHVSTQPLKRKRIIRNSHSSGGGFLAGARRMRDANAAWAQPAALIYASRPDDKGPGRP